MKILRSYWPAYGAYAGALAVLGCLGWAWRSSGAARWGGISCAVLCAAVTLLPRSRSVPGRNAMPVVASPMPAADTPSPDVPAPAKESGASSGSSGGRSHLIAELHQELRRPLHSIMGMSELALTGVDDVQLRHRLDAMVACGQQMLSIVDDALDLSMLDAGELAANGVPFDLFELIEATRAAFLQSALHSQNIVTVSQRWVGSTQVMGDERRLQKALMKLLTHAASIRVDESISLEIWRHRPPDGELVLMSIERSLPEFSADASVPLEIAEDVGLSIAAGIAKALGGSLKIACDDKRLRYLLTVRLPALSGRVDHARAELSIEDCYAALKGLHILVAEDHAINADLLIEQLESLGARVTHVEDGQAALDAAMCAGRRPDVILMDCQMPHMDGFEATQKIRTEEARQGLSLVPIIALTALTFDSEREHSLAVGMNAHLFKPFGSNQLAMTIAQVMKVEPSQARIAAQRTFW